MRLELLIASVLAAALSGAAADRQWICRGEAGAPPLATAPSSDEQIGRAVRDVVLAYDGYSMFDAVAYEVKDGVVTLEGQVLDARRRADIGRRVASLPGVAEVRNKMVVVTDTSDDDRLRRRVARAVYGSPEFARRARERHPLHIVVDEGRVTLRGCVGDEAERARVLRAAREAAGGDVEDGLEVVVEAGKE